MPQRDGDADRSVTTHAKIADVVKEDYAGDAGRIHRRAKQRSDQHVGPARFADDRPPKVVVEGSKSLAPLGQGARPKIGPARGDDAGRFAPRVGINDVNPKHQRACSEGR